MARASIFTTIWLATTLASNAPAAKANDAVDSVVWNNAARAHTVLSWWELCKEVSISPDGVVRWLLERDAQIASIVEEVLRHAPIASALSVSEQDRLKRAMRSTLQDIVFECQHAGEMALPKLIEKKWEAIQRAPTQEETWLAGLALFTLVYFLVLYPAGYVSVMKKIMVDHSPTASLGYVIFGTGSTLGSITAHADGSEVTSVGYGILAGLAGITIGMNEYCKHQLSVGNWKPKHDTTTILSEQVQRMGDEVQQLQERLRWAENDNIELHRSIQERAFSVTDKSNGKTYHVPFDLMERHATLSVYDIDGKPVYFTDGLLRTLGYTKEEIDAYYDEHGEIVSLMYPEQHEQEHVHEFLNELGRSGKGYKAIFYPTAKDGRKLAIEFSTEPLFDAEGNIIGTVRFARDVTGEHAAKQMLDVDMLTGEANRHGFQKRFTQSVRSPDVRDPGKERRKAFEHEFPKNIVMAFGDVDSFKIVNDTYGHGNADVLLKEIAKDLRAALRADDVVARLGGDEFAIICEDGATVESIAPKLHATLGRFARSVFHIRDGVLVDRIECESQLAATEFAKTRNKEWIREGECYAGGVSLSIGLVEQPLTKGFKNEEDVVQFRSRLEQRAEKYAAHFLKHLDKIIPGREGKNGVAYPRFDEEWHPVSVTILYRTAPNEPAEEIVIEGKEKIETALRIIEEEGAKGRLAKMLSIPLGEETMQLNFSDSGELVGATIRYSDGRELVINDPDILRRAFTLTSESKWGQEVT